MAHLFINMINLNILLSFNAMDRIYSNFSAGRALVTRCHVQGGNALIRAGFSALVVPTSSRKLYRGNSKEFRGRIRSHSATGGQGVRLTFRIML